MSIQGSWDLFREIYLRIELGEIWVNMFWSCLLKKQMVSYVSYPQINFWFYWISLIIILRQQTLLSMKQNLDEKREHSSKDPTATFSCNQNRSGTNRENKKVLESNKEFINFSLNNHVSFPYYQDYLQSSQFWTKGFHFGNNVPEEFEVVFTNTSNFIANKLNLQSFSGVF